MDENSIEKPQTSEEMNKEVNSSSSLDKSASSIQQMTPAPSRRKPRRKKKRQETVEEILEKKFGTNRKKRYKYVDPWDYLPVLKDHIPDIDYGAPEPW